jgi:signal transduction histidine kinase
VTHELRTPLNVIIGLCQYLERDPETPLSARQRDTVSRMERNANALLTTVNHLIESLRTGNYE